jgi:hypothetical protein
MTASLYVSMTSGIRGPEGHLPKRQADKAAKLVQQLTEKWPGPNPGGLSHLHATNYVVSWNNADSLVQSVHVDCIGFVSVWMVGATDWTYFKDTVGLWGYIAPYGQKALRKWLDDHEKAIKAHEQNLAILVSSMNI